MMNEYGIVAFRSRQQILMLDTALKQRGLRSWVVSTPRAIALGCGLSVKFDLTQTEQVMDAYRATRNPTLIGFYRVYAASLPLQITPMRFQG